MHLDRGEFKKQQQKKQTYFKTKSVFCFVFLLLFFAGWHVCFPAV